MERRDDMVNHSILFFLWGLKPQTNHEVAKHRLAMSSDQNNVWIPTRRPWTSISKVAKVKWATSSGISYILASLIWMYFLWSSILIFCFSPFIFVSMYQQWWWWRWRYRWSSQVSSSKRSIQTTSPTGKMIHILFNYFLLYPFLSVHKILISSWLWWFELWWGGSKANALLFHNSSHTCYHVTQWQNTRHLHHLDSLQQQSSMVWRKAMCLEKGIMEMAIILMCVVTPCHHSNPNSEFTTPKPKYILSFLPLTRTNICIYRKSPLQYQLLQPVFNLPRHSLLLLLLLLRLPSFLILSWDCSFLIDLLTNTKQEETVSTPSSSYPFYIKPVCVWTGRFHYYLTRSFLSNYRTLLYWCVLILPILGGPCGCVIVGGGTAYTLLIYDSTKKWVYYPTTSLIQLHHSVELCLSS